MNERDTGKNCAEKDVEIFHELPQNRASSGKFRPARGARLDEFKQHQIAQCLSLRMRGCEGNPCRPPSRSICAEHEPVGAHLSSVKSHG